MALSNVPLGFKRNLAADAAQRIFIAVPTTVGGIQVETAKIKLSRQIRATKFSKLSTARNGAELAVGRAVSSFGVSNETFQTFGKRRMSKLNSGQMSVKRAYETSQGSKAARDHFQEKLRSQSGRLNTDSKRVLNVSCSNSSDSSTTETGLQKGKANLENSGSEMPTTHKKVSKMRKMSAANTADSRIRQHVCDSLVSQAGINVEMKPENDREKSMANERKGKVLAPKINSEHIKPASMGVSAGRTKSKNDTEDVQYRKRASQNLKKSTTRPSEAISHCKVDDTMADCLEVETAEENDKPMNILNDVQASTSNRDDIGKAGNKELEKETVEGFKFIRKSASENPTSRKHFLKFKKALSRYVSPSYPLVVEEDDPDWPDEGEEGWGFRLDSFFSDVRIEGKKAEKKDQGDGDDFDVNLEEEDDDEWWVKGITSMEWEETVFGDPRPVVVLMYTRHGIGWSINWHMLQELEKSVKFLWESRRIGLRAAKMDGRSDKDLATALKVKEFPTLLFIKGGKLLHHLRGFKRSEEILDFIAHFFYGGPRPSSLI